jgi:hypothetical protein
MMTVQVVTTPQGLGGGRGPCQSRRVALGAFVGEELALAQQGMSLVAPDGCGVPVP